MEPSPNVTGKHAALSRKLAAVAVRNEHKPELWRGYFERLLSGETIGPLPWGDGDAKATGHAVSGQYAFRLKPEPGESPGPSSSTIERFRSRLIRLGEKQVSLGVDLSDLPVSQFPEWMEALGNEVENRPGGNRKAPVNFSLHAEHGGYRSLLAAAEDSTTAFRATIRVGANSLGSGSRWEELVRASHTNPRIELVLSGGQPPLTDLMGTEKPDTVMPLSLFEAPGESAWLGIQFDLSAIPGEQIQRGTGHLKKLVRVGVRLADNLIDSVDWPSGDLREDALANRRLAAHVTGIGDLVQRHGLDPEDFSTLRLILRWLRLFKRQLLRESLRLARERGPYPALDAQQLVDALAPRYGEARAQRIIARRSPRHRQLLALSPYCVLPRAPADFPPRAWLSLLPVISIADNITMYGSRARSMLNRAEYERLLRSTWALLQDKPGA